MFTWSLIALIFFVFVNNGSGSTKPDGKNNSTFLPSHQWKKIEENQAIPSGLHVRINLNTGQKEAKFIDEENDEKKTSLIPTEKSSENVVDDFENNVVLGPEYIKRFLKNMKSKQTEVGEGLKKKFRTLDELKETFGQVQTLIKTDIEIMTELIENFKKYNIMKVKDINIKSDEPTEDKEVLAILVNLEYLVHQYDNAQDFAKLNGFSDVVYKSLNSSSSEIRSEALKILGSATQSNPKVQIAALETGSINLLLKIFSLDEDVTVRSRSIYALSCLIRRFPMAQQKLITNGGLSAFAKVFDEKKQNLMKLQLKIIRLIHDLLIERIDTKMNILEEENKNQIDSKTERLRERLRQYEIMDLEKKLVEQDWCKRISDWLLKQNNIMESSKSTYSGVTLNSIDFEYHESVGNVVDTLYVLSDVCKSKFQSDSDFLNLLFTLKEDYSKLASEESEDDYGNQLYSGLSKVLKMLGDKLNKTFKKDEL